MNRLNELLLPLVDDWYVLDETELDARYAGVYRDWFDIGVASSGAMQSGRQSATRSQGYRPTCLMFAITSAM